MEKYQRQKTEIQSMIMGSMYDFTKVQTDPTITIRNIVT